MNCVIVDDEPNAVEYLSKIIKKEIPEITVVGKAFDIQSALKIISQTQPDLLFLDIEMPLGSGFDLVEQLDNKNLNVIFVTAYDNYAIQAFKHSAVDYVLKPVDIEDLKNAVDKVSRNQLNSAGNISVLLENLKQTSPKKLSISTSRGYEYLDISTIVRIEAERSYSHIHLGDHRKIMVSKGLNEFNNLLSPTQFFRIHNSHLVNLQHVKMYVKNDGGYLEMVDGSKIPVARRKKELFVDAMNSIIY